MPQIVSKIKDNPPSRLAFLMFSGTPCSCHHIKSRSLEIRSSVPTWHICLTYKYLGRCSERSLQPFAPTVFIVATAMSTAIRNFRRPNGRLARGGSLNRIQRKNSRKMIYYKTVNSTMHKLFKPAFRRYIQIIIY